MQVNVQIRFCADGHPLLSDQSTAGQWAACSPSQVTEVASAAQLRPGHELLGTDGSRVVVQSVVHLEERADVFNFQVRKVHHLELLAAKEEGGVGQRRTAGGRFRVVVTAGELAVVGSGCGRRDPLHGSKSGHPDPKVP